jgi:crotonobetainyl-CoA:carnitine CoA-transferase CaiB-like acyl-CoA transferase
MEASRTLRPLDGIHLVSLAGNVPGPVAAARLHAFGARITKVEPPSGDPLAQLSPAWYGELVGGQEVIRLDLKDPAQRPALDRLLAWADLLLTSTRPGALERLGMQTDALQARYPRLSQIAIVGYPAPEENRAGHDLTYQASAGLASPPQLPRTLVADLAAAERVVSAALALLWGRERGHSARYVEVSLAEAAASFAAPLRHGLTGAGAPLGGALAGYRLYRARDGWVALAALEPHFWKRLAKELGLRHGAAKELEQAFLVRTAGEWQEWARARDLPLAAVVEELPMGNR